MAGMSSRMLAQIRTASQTVTDISPEVAATDEAFWATVAQAFHLDGRHVILNGGGQNRRRAQSSTH
jgi:hypothetical protein